MVAGLRLLSAHNGTLSFAMYDELYNKMSWWQSFHQTQVEYDNRQCEQGKVKNYNTEFLIVYARDLISSIPSDQTIASNIATRMVAAATFLSQVVNSTYTQLIL